MPDVDIMKYYRGVTPGGVEGDRQFRSTLSTRILETSDSDVARDHLSDEEINDFLSYCGWNLWDKFLADGFLDLHPVAQEAYQPLVSGEAMKVLPPVFVLGEGYPPC